MDRVPFPDYVRVKLIVVIRDVRQDSCVPYFHVSMYVCGR